MRYLLPIFLTLTACSTIGTQNPPVSADTKPIDFGDCKDAFTVGWPKQPGPPIDFLEDLFGWVKNNCHMFAKNSEPKDTFARWGHKFDLSTPKKRCAAGFEIMRATAAFESTYRWHLGEDVSKPDYKKTSWEEEAGLFQTSPNSHVNSCNSQGCERHKYLDDLVQKHGLPLPMMRDKSTHVKWANAMKERVNKDLIFEHFAYMMRHRYDHYGTLIDRENRVGVNLNRACAEHILKKL